MRVLHVETGRHLYGGARQLAYLLAGLKKRGIDSTLAAPADSAILRLAAETGIGTFPLRTASGLGFALHRELLDAIAKHRPDLLHVHSRRLAADLWGGLAAQRSKIPAVLSRRVDNPEPRWVVRWKYRLFAHVIAISDGIRQVLLAEGLAADCVSTVRSAIDVNDFSTDCPRKDFLRMFSLPNDSITVAVVAQLIPRKGHRHLLAVLPTIIDRHPSVEVLFFGQGPQRQALEQAVADAGLGGKVHFAGFRDDLPRWLPCIDIVVHPADMEGLGVSLIQAAASGVPVIASRAGGMPEVVHHEENGLLIRPGDSEQLQRALERLLVDADLRRRMGAAGRALVERGFSIDAMVEGNLAIYRRVLAA